MQIAKSKSNNAPALVLLSALIISLTWLSSEQTFAPTSKNASIAKPSLTIRHKLKGLARKAASAEWFMSQRMYGLGYIPKDAEIRAVEDRRTRMIPELQAKRGLQKSALASLNWEFHGPGNIGGRLRGLLVHPNDPNILYAGSVSGGVWKSTNAGENWAPTMNDLITLNISALEMKPGDPNMLYAGTGEAFFTGDALPGRGLLKTTDGGQTWKRIHVNQGLDSPFITELAVSPANPNMVYASGRKATRLPFPAESIPDPGVSAIFKSTDSGETWENITAGKGIEHDPLNEFDDFAADLEVSPADANIVYASFGLYAAGGIWKTSDAGQSWSRLTNGLPDPALPNLSYNRIELAMAPSNPNVLYASFSYQKKDGDTSTHPNGAMLGLWKTTDAGRSWTQVATPMTINQRNRADNHHTALGSQGAYGNAIIIHPTDPNIVFVAGLDGYKSTDGGNTWSQVSMWLSRDDPENPEGIEYVHADHHVFAFDRSTDPPTLYNGSDGGVARSRDLGATWEIRNTDLAVTQFYYFAAHPTDLNVMFGGTQDNGTPMMRNGKINEWSDITGGDGGPAYFDFNDPATIYASVYRVNMFRAVADYATGGFSNIKAIGFTDGTNGISQADVEGADFFAPFEMSPNNPNVLVLGTNRLLKTTDRGDSWTALSNAMKVPIVAVAIAEGNDDMIWFATQGAQIFKTEDNGATYTEVTGANLPNRFITDIEFDSSNVRAVYLTYSGYGMPHVFKSTDAGGSWTDITNNLPDTPANTIQVHPQHSNLLFLGTDIGVFFSEDGGQTWQPSANNFPTVQVVAINLNTRLNRIYAATHGRGVYSAELSSGGVAVLNVDAQDLDIEVKPGESGTASFNISNTGTAPLTFSIAATSQQAAAMNTNNAGTDVLILDDGNHQSDAFLGEGPGQTFLNYYWWNQFNLMRHGFKLDAVQFYMRTDSASSNRVSIWIVDEYYYRIIFDKNVDLDLAATGQWYTVQLDSSLEFTAGQSFSIRMNALPEIAFPAGVDKNARVRNNSFFWNWNGGGNLNLNTVDGFENGAYLIRAVGTKIGGGDQRLTVILAEGTVPAGGAQTITATFEAQGVAEGDYQGQISITSNGGDLTIPVRIHVSQTTGVAGGDKNAGLPKTFELSQNYPNPFWSEATSRFVADAAPRGAGNPETTIAYSLPSESAVTLSIYDLSGRLVTKFEEGTQTAGQHAVRWNGRDREGRVVAGGIYFYRLQAKAKAGADISLIRKMTLMK